MAVTQGTPPLLRQLSPITTRTRRLAQRGASLVELMVAMTIGLIVALIVVATVTGVGTNLRNVGANAAAQVSAQVSLGLIDEAGRSAGAGLYSNGTLLCPSVNAWFSGAVRMNGTVLMPARITDGGADTASDILVFTASNAAGPLSNMPVVVNMAAPGDAITVNNAGLISEDDVALVGAPGTNAPCTLFQVTAPPAVLPAASCAGNATSCKQLARATDPAIGYNPPDPNVFATPQRYGFTNGGGVAGPAAVSRLGGAFRQVAFQVDCQTLVTYNAFSDVPTCVQNPLSFGGGANALASDIVLMHAQYGISANGPSDVVNAWVNANAAPWNNPAPADVERIKAVRVVIVSRSKEPASQEVTDASCVNANGVVNVGPCSFSDAAAPVIDLSATPVVAGSTWRQYRYRVHRAVIPLRNVLWSN